MLGLKAWDMTPSSFKTLRELEMAQQLENWVLFSKTQAEPTWFTTPVQEDLMPSFDLHEGVRHTRGTHTYMLAKYLQTSGKKLKIEI